MGVEIAVAVIALIGTLIGVAASSESNRKTNEANKELSQLTFEQNQALNEQTHQQNIELWKYQNEYNSPKNQMERLRAAGLNPQLAYGTGNVAGNTTSNVPQLESAKKIAPVLRSFMGYDIGLKDSINAFFQAKMAQSQINLTDANALKVLREADNLPKVGEQISAQIDNLRADIKNKGASYGEILKRIDLLGAQIENINARTDVERANYDSILTNTEFSKWRMKKDQSLFKLQRDLLASNISRNIADANLANSNVSLNDVRSILMRSQTDLTKAQEAQVIAATQKVTLDKDIAAFDAALRAAGINPNSKGYERIFDYVVGLIFGTPFNAAIVNNNVRGSHNNQSPFWDYLNNY